MLYLAFDTLVKYGPDFSIQPELAESWEASADGKRIVFTLREGVTFQDGTPFDADAVKWNIDQRLDEKVNSPQRELLAPIVASVEVIDPRHVAFNLAAPSPVLFSLLGERPGFMVSPTAWQQRGSIFGTQPVGTGAFILKEWTRGSRVVTGAQPELLAEGAAVSRPHRRAGPRRIGHRRAAAADRRDRLCRSSSTPARRAADRETARVSC